MEWLCRNLAGPFRPVSRNRHLTSCLISILSQRRAHWMENTESVSRFI